MSDQLPSKQLTPQPKNDWLSLKAAAEELAVHPTTLRRWADGGKIPVMVTPGGHRRFALIDIQNMTQSSLMVRKPDQNTRIGNIWAETAITVTRQNVSAQPASWMSSLTESDRDKHRKMGQQLMGLTLQFIGAEIEDENILDETRALGTRYGQIGREVGMSLTEALQAAMFFRDRMVESALQLPESAKIRPEANLRLLQRINTLLNEVQLAIASEYE
ncbi:MAG: excisionase family DNA binding protein [Cellvibrionaceae bacterium]|jgi:excisionase family DNA binding protein